MSPHTSNHTMMVCTTSSTVEWMTTAATLNIEGNPLAPAMDYIEKVRERKILLLKCRYCCMTYPALEDDGYVCPCCGARDFDEVD